MTFTERQLALIDEWHQLPDSDPRPLHQYLGLTWDEYKVVAATSLVIENPEFTYPEALDLVESVEQMHRGEGRVVRPVTAECGCPIEYKTARITTHTDECVVRQAADRLANYINDDDGGTDAGDR